MTVAAPAPGRSRARFDRRAAVRAASRGASIGFCGVVPLMMALLMLLAVGDALAFDLHHAFRPAAEAVLDGRSPYPPPTAEALGTRVGFVYLPFASFVFVPFALLPPLVADIAATILVTATGGLALWILGVRDWRCYGIAVGSAPVIAAIQSANLTLPLALALALVWIGRSRPVLPGVALALTLATKLFLWPVLVWLVATRRYRAAAGALVTTGALVLGSWTLIGFAGAREYPEILQVLAATLEWDSYTPFALALDLGASAHVARAIGLGLAVAVLGACWVLGRRGHERRSFTLAIVAALLFTPIVWLHYFALLFVPIAITHKRMSALWAAPFAVWFFGSGNGNGTTLQTALMLATAGAVVALTVRAAERGPMRARYG